MRFFCSIPAAFSLCAAFAQATQIPAGPVSGHWPASGNPYQVRGDIFVPAPDTLILDPGVEVFFQYLASLTVHGLLLAQGETSDSILFTIADTSLHWHGLRFINAPDSSRLSYCIIQHSYAAPGNPDYRGGGISCSNSQPVIERCTIRHNQALIKGGGIALLQGSNARIERCEIVENICGGDGGGIYCESSAPQIRHCTISRNWALAAGGVHCFEADPEISHCLISNNDSQTDAGGIGMSLAHPIITNCTVANNRAAFLGAGIMVILSQIDLRNSIIAGNLGFCGIYNYLPGGRLNLAFSDFYDNEGGNIGGEALPDSFEILVSVNANGDSCDVFYNLFADPLFYAESGDSAFHLTASSPGIDAGDPLTPLDPDGTTADMGAYYFDQANPAPASITLTPYGTPIVIPANGGAFNCNIEGSNLTTSPLDCDVWCDVTLPSGTIYGPVLGPVMVTLPIGASLDRDRTQNVPASAPAGNYSFNAYIGDYPGTTWDSDTFPFTKFAFGGWGQGANDWVNSGESFESEQNFLRIYNLELRTSASPNPFNATTVISFQLPSRSFMHLAVYDLSGRTIAELINGWREAGACEVTFDGAHLPSGIYVYRLRAGSIESRGKMIVLK